MKSPFNWVGNKYTYIDIINQVVKDKEFNNITEMFMGTGNILLNIDVEANRYVGNDKTRLLPKIYENITSLNNKFNKDELNQIIKKWNNFSQKEDYYNFRTYWNKRYFNNQFDREFVYETSLLLKMCSNSMVRFNQKGEFNQGFRGLGDSKEFFQDSMKDLIVDGLSELHENLNKRNYKFSTEDMVNVPFNKDDLLILDPPYILQQGMYTQDFTEQHDNYLLEILKSDTKFIYFNYIERDGQMHTKLNDVINDKNLITIDLSSKTKSGQGTNKVTKVREILVTNIR